ncbi:MAG: AraC family transcriptional regulator [Bacillales bacterium]|jgi:AraC family transcriptional regulator|nr:AraC family transcriptional regulator [Bacillales bacterium]
MNLDSIKQMNLAMKYIEEHLTEEIDWKEVSQIAACSEYHFKRMFSFLSGMSVGEYVRRRRLTLAVTKLKGNKDKIIDIALSIGYDSPDSFTKAFQMVHGVTPSQVRKSSVNVKAFPPMTFQLTIQGGTEMNFRIVDKDTFQIVGIKKRITLQYEGVNTQMDSMWASLTMDDFIELKQLSNVDPNGILCVSANLTEGREEGTELDQYIGVATTSSAPSRWEILNVEASTWAVFTAVGPFPQELQSTWARIYSEWFPTSGYELTGGPEILWNESPDTSKPDYKSEIWIPVKRKL